MAIRNLQNSESSDAEIRDRINEIIAAVNSGSGGSGSGGTGDGVAYNGPATKRHCANNNLLNTTFNAAFKYIEGNSYFVAAVDMRNWVSAYWNGRVDVSLGSACEVAVGASNAALIVEYEYPVGSGTWERAQWTVGGDTGVLGPNAVVEHLPITLYIPKGGLARRRYYFTNPDGVPYSSTPSDPANAYGANVTPPGYVRDKALGVNLGAAFLPVYTCCVHNQPAANYIGDSHTAGTGDTADSTRNVGVVGRTLGRLHGYANLAVPSETAAKALTSYTIRRTIADLGTYNVVYLGTNDMYGGALATAAHASIQSLLALPGITGKPTFICTVTPNVTGTYASEGAQTINAPFQAQAQLFNETLRAGVAGCWGVCDLAKAVESTTTPGKIQCPDGKAITLDGLHYNRIGQLKIHSSGVMLAALVR